MIIINNLIEIYKNKSKEYNNLFLYSLDRSLIELSIDTNLTVSIIDSIDSGYLLQDSYISTNKTENYSYYSVQEKKSLSNTYINDILSLLKKIKNLNNVHSLDFNGMYIWDDVFIIKSLNSYIKDNRHFLTNNLNVYVNINHSLKCFNFKFSNEIEKYYEFIYNKISNLSTIEICDNYNLKEINEVVFSNGTFGIIIHEAIGHMLEADYFYKNKLICKYLNITNKYIKENLLIKDFTHEAENFLKLKFDDDGRLYKEKTLVINGTISEILSNIEFDKDSKYGNGRRQDYKNKSLSRMSMTFIERGNYSYDYIFNSLSSVTKSLEIANIQNAYINPDSGDLSIQCTEVYLIDNKKKKIILSNITLSINVYNLFNNIEYIGSDLTFKPGSCIKKDQNINIVTGSPTIKIKGDIWI